MYSRQKVNRSLFNFHLKATKALLSRCSGVHVSVRNASKAQAALCNILDAQINDIKHAGTWKDERVISTRQASEIGVIGRNDKLLNFCANNYLGLSVSLKNLASVLSSPENRFLSFKCMQFQLSLHVCVCVLDPGGYSIYPWVGRCSLAPHTLHDPV